MRRILPFVVAAALVWLVVGCLVSVFAQEQPPDAKYYIWIGVSLTLKNDNCESAVKQALDGITTTSCVGIRLHTTEWDPASQNRARQFYLATTEGKARKPGAPWPAQYRGSRFKITTKEKHAPDKATALQAAFLSMLQHPDVEGGLVQITLCTGGPY